MTVDIIGHTMCGPACVRNAHMGLKLLIKCNVIFRWGGGGGGEGKHVHVHVNGCRHACNEMSNQNLRRWRMGVGGGGGEERMQY